MALLFNLTILSVAMALLVDLPVARACEWTLLPLNFASYSSLMFSFRRARRWLGGPLDGDTCRSTKRLLSLTGRRLRQRTIQASDRRTSRNLELLADELPDVWLLFWKVWLLVPSLWPVASLNEPQEAADQNSNHYICQFFMQLLNIAFSNLPFYSTTTCKN